MRENDPSLDQCINIVKAAERARQYVAVLKPNQAATEQETESMEVDKIQHNQRRSTKCKYCGRIHDKYCPAYGKKCNGCGKYNHFQAVCPNGTRNRTLFNRHKEYSREEQVRNISNDKEFKIEKILDVSS